MRPEVVADQNVRAEKQRTHMQVIGANPALGARALQDLLAAERVVADLGMDQTYLQPQVAAAAAVNALQGAFMAWFLAGASGDPSPPSTRRLTCWNTASARSVRPPAAIPAPRSPMPFGQRRTRRRGCATRYALTCRPTKRPSATTSGLPVGPWDAGSHQSHGTSIRSVPRGQPDASGG
jgi:hypothetical protein